MTDDEIREAIQKYFETEFQNFGGDVMLECAMDCDEDAYWRAEKLLPGAKIVIMWPPDNGDDAV